MYLPLYYYEIIVSSNISYLKVYFYDINIATLAFCWLPFAWHIFAILYLLTYVCL